MIGEISDLSVDYKTGKTKATFLIEVDPAQIEEYQNQKLNIEVKKYREKRSLNANNYFWKLLQELCEMGGIDTIEEYKRRVKELGIFRRFRIETENVKTFEKMWSAQGIAWFSEIFDTEYVGNIEFKIIHSYYGSSSFNSKQMSRLIDGVVQDCNIYGIETKTEEEIKSLLDNWGN
jgi:hypothetical protein